MKCITTTTNTKMSLRSHEMYNEGMKKMVFVKHYFIQNLAVKNNISMSIDVRGGLKFK